MFKIVIAVLTATALILAPTQSRVEIYTPDAISGGQGLVKRLYTVARYTDEEVYFMANCVQAEAGNQGETGKRLVASVILNRVESEKYPNTIKGVITQKGQFTSYTDGGMDRWKPTEETIEICWLEIYDRTENGFLFFKTTPFAGDSYKHKDHYFK